MQPQPTPARIAPTPAGVLFVDGYGVNIRVERGRLVVADGTGRARRLGQFERPTSRLRRVVLLGHTGSITLDALRWMSDVGVGFTTIDADGQVLVASAGMGRDDPRLRRAQALAIDTALGNDVARRLLAEKVAGQAATLSGHLDLVNVTDATIADIDRAASHLHVATSRDELRQAEAHAAAAYWAAWTAVPIMFTHRDAARVPTHWRTFGTRSSPLTGNPRLAANPANAILNYLYAILEAEARIGCLAVGLDPGLGVLHADLKARDSLALDVMEAVRPKADAYVLDVLAQQVFQAADFHETRQGACRLLAPMTHRLAETGPIWAGTLGPIVENVARLILGSPDHHDHRSPTPLTGTNRSASRPTASRRRRHRGPQGSAPRRPVPRCDRCGATVASANRKLCVECLTTAVTEQRESFARAGNARLTELRRSGAKPGIGGEAGRVRGAKVSAARLANEAWEQIHPEASDPARFARELLPCLAGLTARQVAAATGLSRPYCSAILQGKRTPHPRWWDQLVKIATWNAT